MNQSGHILIVDDEETLCDTLAFNLEQEGYSVDTAYSAEEALTLPLADYDLVLLDIMMGDISGLQLAKIMKSNPATASVAIIFCTARDTEDDLVEGLDLGADDYIAKPFYMAELSARIKSVVRRGAGSISNRMTAGNMTLDLTARCVEVDGKPLTLLKKEYDILLYFMQRPGHIVDKAMLAESVWGDHIDTADNFDFVYAQVKNLRKRLDAAGASLTIKAVYGFGYKLAEVEK